MNTVSIPFGEATSGTYARRDGRVPFLPGAVLLDRSPSVLSTTLGTGGGGKNMRDHVVDATRRRPRVAVHSLGDVVARVRDDPPWIWSGYLARGSLTLLAGRPKVGKSSLVYAALPLLADGRRFLDREVTATGAIVLSEEPWGAVAEKARRFGIASGAGIVSRAETYGISWPEIVDDVAGRCSNPGLGLLVVDTIGEWAGLRGDAENQSGSVQEALEPLKRAAAAYDLAVCS